MDNNDCDLFSIVHSCKANAYTSSTTILETLPPPQTLTTASTTTSSIISPQNTTPFYLDDFSLTQENRSVGFSPLKPTDFIELDKLKINFNPTTVVPAHTTTIPITVTPTTTALYTPTTTITTRIPVPTHISTTTNTNTSTINHDSNQNSNFFDFPTFNRNIQMQPTDIRGPEKIIPSFLPTTIIPTPTMNNLTTNIPISISTNFPNLSLPTNIFISSAKTTAPSITTMINTNTGSHGTNNYPKMHNFPKLFEQQQTEQNQNNQLSALKPAACVEITTAHFDLAYNHPSISKQNAREINQPPTIQPHTSSMILPNTNPQGELLKNKKKKFDNKKIVEWHISEEKLAEDPWQWRKYGQKLIKGSQHPRDYYRCSTFKDCVAKKLVEKKQHKENIYVVTYIGEHNHPKPFVDWSLQNKSSKKRVSSVKKYESLQECSHAQVHQGQSKKL
ncbi:unnamed protein product [Lathyrus sativus]|nr:unnamed protein product [Lathyrus sativus]